MADVTYYNPGYVEGTLVTPSGNWVVPAGVFQLLAGADLTHCKGAGGGGGGPASSEPYNGGGGGGGEYAGISSPISVTPGQLIAYSIGIGGTAGGSDQAGGAGGDSSFGAVLVAKGGAGGTLDDLSAPGGTGGTGDVLYAGGAGLPMSGGGNGGAAGTSSGAGSDGGGLAPGVSPSGWFAMGAGGYTGDNQAGGLGQVIVAAYVRSAPTNIDLSAATVAENASTGTAIGTLTATDADTGDGDTVAFSLAAGILDNDSFQIADDELQSAAVFNYEARSSYTVRVTATDSYSLEYDEDFVITVTEVNEAPTDIALSNTTVASGSASGTTVGALTTTDADAGDSHTYSLAAAADNASFTLTGANLKTAFLADYSTRNLFTVQVTAHDAGGLTFDENFTISITSTDDADEEQQAMSLTISTPLSEGIDTSLSASQALTVPAGARRLTVQALGQNVRCKLSGTVTASTGFQIAVGQIREFVVHPSFPSSNGQAVAVLEAIRFIEETSGASLVYSFFAN